MYCKVSYFNNYYHYEQIILKQERGNKLLRGRILIDPHGKIAAANPTIEDLKKWGMLTGTDRRMPQHSPCVPMQTEQD